MKTKTTSLMEKTQSVSPWQKTIIFFTDARLLPITAEQHGASPQVTRETLVYTTKEEFSPTEGVSVSALQVT